MAGRPDAGAGRIAPSQRGWAALISSLCLAAVIGLIIAPSGIPLSTGGASRSSALDSALQQARTRLGVPGVSAAVIQRGQAFWAGSSGTKLQSGGDPITPDTLFITASTAKTVTAAMTMRLVQEGRLRLDQTVGRYLPQLRDGNRITVRELLQHTSGLPNYLDSPRVQRLLSTQPQHAWTRAEVLRSIGHPSYRPGTRSTYSDSNYIALGGIIEAVEGAPFEDDFERLVAGPLSLSKSSWRYDDSQIGRFAQPTVERSDGSRFDPWQSGTINTGHWGEVWTDGGLASTATELAEIGHATVMGPLLNPATRRQMTNFNSDGFGLGVFDKDFLGRAWVGHAGLWAGFTSEHWTLKRRGLTIAVLTDLQPRPGAANPAEAIFKSLAQVALSG
jgi:D-alanyl-D-alanine carboxypeptidase